MTDDAVLYEVDFPCVAVTLHEDYKFDLIDFPGDLNQEVTIMMLYLT